ncbi:tellurite resistance protein TehB [mine drainage metagenome]|uniref:Tellurite resistance protein TehB n=1 Tax=mine drainage metagenome TaxID=410659 RepID=A0A1J5QAK2_9ZZZZ
MGESVERTAASWELEYAQGRYLDEAPVEFVSDILAACSVAGLIGNAGLYVGCGNGRNLLPLVLGGLDLVGLDISATAIAQLRERLPGRADRLVVGDLGVLPFDLTYPMVIGIQVFQHGTREATHEHIRAAQARTDIGGLFCLRVNAIGTDIHQSHEVVEKTDSGFTIRYTSGSKNGLNVHFFAATELHDLFADKFEPVLPLRLHSTPRKTPGLGQWSQWEGIWRRIR